MDVHFLPTSVGSSGSICRMRKRLRGGCSLVVCGIVAASICCFLILLGVGGVIAWKFFLNQEVCSGFDKGADLSKVASLIPDSPLVPINPDHPKCRIKSGQACPMAEMPRGKSTLVYPGGETECIDTSEPYAFQIFPGDTDKLLIFFQGGGACWGKASTVYSIPGNILPKGFCTQTLYEQRPEGIFDASEPRNPWKDYTILHLQYCSGDGHAGNITQDYYIENDNGQCHKVSQKGYINARAAIDWVKQQMDPALSDLLVSGSSAGSLGTQMWANQILTEFKSDGLSYDSAAIVVDSYAAIFPPNSMTRTMKAFGVCDTSLITGKPAQGCAKDSGHEDNDLTMAEVWKQAMTDYPAVPFAHVQSKVDSIQLMFYKAIAASYADKDLSMIPEMAINKKGFYAKIVDLFTEYNKFPNYVSYLVTGGQHTFFFYTDEAFEGNNQDGLPACNFFRADTNGKNGMGANNATLMYKWASQFPIHDGNEMASSECSEPDKSDSTDYCDPDLSSKTLNLR